jgi:hypothetical protein
MTRGHATNLVGLRCGRLTVVERAANRGKHSYWRCVCDCGNVTEVGARHMIGANVSVKSCGCLRAGVAITKEHRLKAAAAAQESKLRATRLQEKEPRKPAEVPVPKFGKAAREALADLAVALGYLGGKP